MEHENVIDALNSEIEPMSQETADALIDAFQKFNENMGVTQETLANFNKVINQEVARQSVDKLLGYAEKFICATFLTRWYWKRKAFDAAQTVKMVSEFLNNCE